MTLPRKLEDWPTDARNLYEERAGILEYEANFPRWKAEIMAERDVRKNAAQWSDET